MREKEPQNRHSVDTDADALRPEDRGVWQRQRGWWWVVGVQTALGQDGKKLRPRAELQGGLQTVRSTGHLLLLPPGQGRWGQQDQG